MPVPVTAQDEFGVLQRVSSDVIDKLAGVLGKVEDSGKHMAQSAFQIATISKEIAEISHQEQSRSEAVNKETQALSDIARIRQEVAKVIFGQESVIEQTLLAVLSGGHALLVGVPSWLSSHQAMPPNKPSHNKRQNMRQRRVARCSAKVAKTNFSSTARSHPGAGAGAGGLLTGAARVDDVCEPHRSGAAWESGGAEPGR